MRLGKAFLIALAMLILDGTAQARMVMQTYPVLVGAGAHDVYPAPDGTIWFTAQSAGKLGRLDPRTGKSDLIALGVPGASLKRFRPWAPSFPRIVIISPVIVPGPH